MPSFRKLNPDAIAAAEQRPLSTRAQVAQAYDALLAGFALGDYGRAELLEGERRGTVRRQLQAAAKRRGLALRFRSGPGPLTFRVEAAPAPVQEPVGAPLVGAQHDQATRRDPVPPRPPRPPRRRPTAAERYHEVLPRWMREGQPPGRRGDSKRRHGR